MIVVTTADVAGHTVAKTLGMVRGSSIRARHLGRDIVAGLRNLAGGELYEYTKLLAEAREQAIDRMVEEAKVLGANAVVAVRFQSAEVSRGAAEMLAYGTAVIVGPSS
ncbi:MAG: YbjQ family protein [Gemmatimonadetes bacterium]|nr:YbjQ family protein [Gemmatimonadota bacterium]